MKKKIAIIGGGPSAIFLALFLDKEKYEVSIFEKNNTIGRKFLVAGKGGFNLTHSDDVLSILQRFYPKKKLDAAIRNFDNQALRKFYKEIGIPTFIGSSKRIFPVQGIKPIEVLNSIVGELKDLSVNIVNNHEWSNWDKEGNLVFENGIIIKADFHVFAFGGASWKVTGSDGSWLNTFAENGINTVPFVASNCAFRVDWPGAIKDNFLGTPLKNIAIHFGSEIQKGELVITALGLEGSPIYAMSREFQEQLAAKGKVQVHIDFKPSLSLDKVAEKLVSSNEKRVTDSLRKDLKLSNVVIKLVKTSTTKEEFQDLKVLATLIKKFPLDLIGSAPIDEAISTMGGIPFEELNESFELKKIKNNFCIGEMVDWDAPTGGYLLQACCSMGVFLAQHLNTIHQDK